MYKRNSQGWRKHIDFILWDVVALQLALVLSFAIRHHGVLLYTVEAYRTLAILFAVVDVLIAIAFNTMHGVMSRGYYIEFVQSLKQSVLVLVLMTLYLFTIKSGSDFSRLTVYLAAVFHLVLGYVSRQLWKPVVRRVARERQKASMLLVADEEQAEEILARYSGTEEFEFTGVVLSDRDATGEQIGGIRVVAGLQDAADYICREWVDEVFVYPRHLGDIEHPEEPSVATLIEQCRQMAVPVHIRLPLANIGGKCFVENIGGYDVLTSASNYASPLQLALKRLMDILGGLIGSVFALLIMAVVGPMIKHESPGPILFRQTRIGQNGKKFRIYKIRSMYMDAEERKQELLKDNRVSDGMMFKLEWDPRIIGNKIVDGKQVTGIGEFLRSHSLDEFPQFFNVLLNQMSLVGTRPPTVDEWEKYKYHHRARLATKPGITGMWQVSGRSEITDFEEVVRLDTEYINHWSVGLDLRILAKTVKAVVKRDGAM